jgi:hypothetical protein
MTKKNQQHEVHQGAKWVPIDMSRNGQLRLNPKLHSKLEEIAFT